MKNRGSILVGVLWCMVLLSLLVIGVLHTARMDLMVGKNYSDRVQAHYLALAGVERTKALLYKDLVTRQGTPKNHTGSYYDDAKDFRDVSLGRGKFQIFHRAPEDDGGDIVYGISDEESRLNLNVVSANELTNLAGMTSDILGAIMTWRTAATQNPAGQQGNNSDTSAAGGANSDYYMSLRPPYMARNGPFQTVRELLMVRGVTTELLMGNDENQNGFLDSDDDSPGSTPPPGVKPPPPSPGWEPLLTVADRDLNVNASGKARINPQTADQATLWTVSSMTPEIAGAIVSYRGPHQLQNLDDLLNVTAQNTNNNNGNNNNNNGGPTVISQDLLEKMADDLSFAGGQEQEGLINVNTAGLDVLISLPGVDRTLAQAIINYRKSSGYFDNVASLFKVDGMTRDIFRQLTPLITVRSETYRIICEGKINSSGTRQRVEEIVHIGRNDIETLSYREDL